MQASKDTGCQVIRESYETINSALELKPVAVAPAEGSTIAAVGQEMRGTFQSLLNSQASHQSLDGLKKILNGGTISGQKEPLILH